MKIYSDEIGRPWAYCDSEQEADTEAYVGITDRILELYEFHGPRGSSRKKCPNTNTKQKAEWCGHCADFSGGDGWHMWKLLISEKALEQKEYDGTD